MYWDENKIAFPRRSPTIYPGEAFKLYKQEQIELEERMEDQDQSDTEEHSAVLDSSEEAELSAEEREWHDPSRKWGVEANLADI